MRSQLPVVFFVCSILIGGVVFFEPWVSIVGRVTSPDWNVTMVAPWAIIIGDPSVPAQPEDNTSLRFWEDEPISLYISPCPLMTYLETPVLVHSYETFLNSGRAIFGAIILCWAVFGFLHRRILTFIHLSRRHWIIIDIVILFILCASLVYLIPLGIWCENRSEIIIRQVTLIWPTVIISLLGLCLGVAAILTSRHNAGERQL